MLPDIVKSLWGRGIILVIINLVIQINITVLYLIFIIMKLENLSPIILLFKNANYLAVL